MAERLVTIKQFGNYIEASLQIFESHAQKALEILEPEKQQED